MNIQGRAIRISGTKTGCTPLWGNKKLITRFYLLHLAMYVPSSQLPEQNVTLYQQQLKVNIIWRKNSLI